MNTGVPPVRLWSLRATLVARVWKQLDGWPDPLAIDQAIETEPGHDTCAKVLVLDQAIETAPGHELPGDPGDPVVGVPAVPSQPVIANSASATVKNPRASRSIVRQRRQTGSIAPRGTELRESPPRPRSAGVLSLVVVDMGVSFVSALGRLKCCCELSQVRWVDARLRRHLARCLGH
ncbi:MAG: hypothetical protein ABIY55_32050, partial [Kofleriaceae bacterium]